MSCFNKVLVFCTFFIFMFFIPTSDLNGQEICGMQEIELIAAGGDGVGIVAGSVIVTNDDTGLTIELNSEPGWFFGMTHVHTSPIINGDIMGALNNFPLTKGGLPKPGKFESKVDGEGNQTTITHPTISLLDENGDPVSSFLIAVHAEMIRVEDGSIVLAETAWAKGQEFNAEKNWSMYFVYDVVPCDVSICPCWPNGLHGSLLENCLIIDFSFFAHGRAVTSDGNFEIRPSAHGCFGVRVTSCVASPDIPAGDLNFCLTREETDICMEELKEFCPSN